MQSSYWTYQKREVSGSWAINAILTYPRGHKEKAAVAFVIYSEKIYNSVHCMTINKHRYLHRNSVKKRLIDALDAFSIVTKEDEEQITDFIKHILPHLKGYENDRL